MLICCAFDDVFPLVTCLSRTPPRVNWIFPIQTVVQRVCGPLDILKEAWTAQGGEESPAVVHMMEM